MIRFILKRRVSVSVLFFSLTALGILAVLRLPVSLLPPIDAPYITLRFQVAALTAQQIDSEIVQPFKAQLVQLYGLEDLQSRSEDGAATISLRFQHGSNMDLAYIEANEKTDRIMQNMPRTLQRPRLLKSSASDIPVFYLAVRSKANSNKSFKDLSHLVELVIKKRIEQLESVAFADLSGTAPTEVHISLAPLQMQSLGLDIAQIQQLLQEQNQNFGTVRLQAGIYEYALRIENRLTELSQIENLLLPIPKSNRRIPLKDIASIKVRQATPKGIFQYQGQRALCLAIVKESDAQILSLKEDMNALLEAMRQDYPDLAFDINQDQTELLSISINNLISSLLTSALLTFLLLFLFVRSVRQPFIIGLIIPVALAVVFLVFFLLKVSINIVSLAGLVLAVGEIIDSAVIIIESIEDELADGHSLEESCIRGSENIIKPLFASVMTNSAVFLPLILMSGIAGDIFYEQALSVTIGLMVSLLCSYVLVPVLYVRASARPTWLYARIEAFYRWFFDFFYGRVWLTLLCGSLALGGAVAVWPFLEREAMPKTQQRTFECRISWAEPLSATASAERLQSILATMPEKPVQSAVFAGFQSFLLNPLAEQGAQELYAVLECVDENAQQRLQNALSSAFKRTYPLASLELKKPKNAFEQIFGQNEPDVWLKLQTSYPMTTQDLNAYRFFLEKNALATEAPAVRQILEISPRYEAMSLYGVSHQSLMEVLQTAMPALRVMDWQRGQQSWPVLLRYGGFSANVDSLWAELSVRSNSGHFVPLRELAYKSPVADLRYRFGGKEGSYTPLYLAAPLTPETALVFCDRINSQENPLKNAKLSAHGYFLQKSIYFRELLWSILLSLLLMYCILAAQFESFVQPLVVILMAFMSLSGALCVLWLSNTSLNLFSVIGLIVLIGLSDNDSILKIDQMNKLSGSSLLQSAMRTAGLRRLKSQIMTYLTTVLGLLPILFAGGLGADLQRPLAVAVLGGLSFSVWLSWTLLPLLYRWFQFKTK